MWHISYLCYILVLRWFMHYPRYQPFLLSFPLLALWHTWLTNRLAFACAMPASDTSRSCIVQRQRGCCPRHLSHSATPGGAVFLCSHITTCGHSWPSPRLSHARPPPVPPSSRHQWLAPRSPDLWLPADPQLPSFPRSLTLSALHAVVPASVHVLELWRLDGHLWRPCLVVSWWP